MEGLAYYPAIVITIEDFNSGGLRAAGFVWGD